MVFEQEPTVVLCQLDWIRVQRIDIDGVNDNDAQPAFYNFESMRRTARRP